MTNAIKEYVKYYTIHFRDKSELDIPEQTYEVIKQNIENWVYDIEINGWLYNLHFTNYSRIVPREEKDPVKLAIMSIKPMELREWIKRKEKERKANFPLKKPFTSIEHLETFISMWKKELWLE